MHQDDGQTEVATQEFDMKDQHFSIPSASDHVIIAKLKKNSHRTNICEYKIDTDHDGNLMSISMYRSLFLHTNVNEKSPETKNSLVHL